VSLGDCRQARELAAFSFVAHAVDRTRDCGMAQHGTDRGAGDGAAVATQSFSNGRKVERREPVRSANVSVVQSVEIEPVGEKPLTRGDQTMTPRPRASANGSTSASISRARALY
jgi:hypothetical protein